MTEAPRSVPSEDDAVTFLRDLVATPSLSGHEEQAVALAVATMRRWGLHAKIDAAGNAVGEAGDGLTHLVLLGHIDTVAGEIPVRREGDQLYGRGSVDAKGPLATFIVALARSGALPKLRLTVIGAVEEEAATSKGAYYAVERYHPAACVIGEPSSWDRICLGYKGRLLLDYVLERGMTHTAGQERSASEEAVGFWQQLAQWAADYNRDRQSRFETLDPSLRSINTLADGLRERVEMHIGLRLPLDLDPTVLLAALEQWRGQAEVTPHARELPFRADKRTPLAGAFLAAIRAEGGKPAYLTKTGTSDMNVVGPRWGCPIVAYGPGDSSLDHTPEEHIEIPDYLAAIRVLTRVLQRMNEIA